MHKNYHIFKADTNYDLGLMMGKQFSIEAKNAIERGKKDDWENKKATSIKFLDITQKYFPELLDEVKGYAKGADVDFIDLWTISLEFDTELIAGVSGKCTNVITNNGKLIGHNEDADVGSENNVCLVKKVLNGLTMFEIYYYNTLGGSTVGITSNGYAHTVNTLFFTNFEFGVPKNVLARHLFETKNPDKTVNAILKLPRTSGYNHNIISKDGKIWNLELTSRDGVLTNPHPPFCHSNHCLNIKTTTNNNSGTLSRLKFAKDNVKENMTIDELIKLQNDTSDGPNESIFNERTVGKMIIDLENMIAKIWLLREKELGWVDYPLDFIV